MKHFIFTIILLFSTLIVFGQTLSEQCEGSSWGEHYLLIDSSSFNNFLRIKKDIETTNKQQIIKQLQLMLNSLNHSTYTYDKRYNTFYEGFRITYLEYDNHNEGKTIQKKHIDLVKAFLNIHIKKLSSNKFTSKKDKEKITKLLFYWLCVSLDKKNWFMQPYIKPSNISINSVSESKNYDNDLAFMKKKSIFSRHIFTSYNYKVFSSDNTQIDFLGGIGVTNYCGKKELDLFKQHVSKGGIIVVFITLVG